MMMNRGMDFYNGGLVPEDKMRGPIFKFSFRPEDVYSPPGRPDLKFLKPREITITPYAHTLEQTNSILYYSFQQFIKADIERYDFGLSIGKENFSIGGKYSKEYG